MPIQIETSLTVGGLDLTTPPISISPGKAIAAINYEPDIGGYTSVGGFERFDGRPRPSDIDDPGEVEARRAAIGPVPGIGPVRGIWVFNDTIYAFRDQGDGTAKMFRSTQGGWNAVTYGSIMQFTLGVKEFLVGEYIAGTTSASTAKVDRVVLRAGAWNGTAEGYLIVSDITGTFVFENITSGSGGAAKGNGLLPVVLKSGGRYEFFNHNFYGSAGRERMYFASGTDTAYEWSGTVLAPILTGMSGGEPVDVTTLLAANGDTILATNDDRIIMGALFDAPSYIAHYKNHLFLGFSSGTLINSSLGEPLEFVTTTGAGETAFGQQLTGLLSAASTALVVFAQNRIEYLTGDDTTTFTIQPISDASGAQPYTMQMMDSPMFLDDGGVRILPTTAAFGDWRLGTVTQMVEKLVRQKRDRGILAVASLRVKAKDQYKLFWEDGSGITIYIGRKNPEVLPFKLPIDIFCTCSGEVEVGRGDRLFVGCYDGFVYELNRGTSYDGTLIQSFIRLPFTSAKSPSQQTRWMKVTYEIDTPDTISMGVAFDVDYGKGLGGDDTYVTVDAGSATITSNCYPFVDWVEPVQGRLEYHLCGIGPNISTTLIHESAIARQHTISSQTYNYSRRGLKR